MKKDNVIAEELERISQENDGRLMPLDVVREASNPKSPLHSKFEWDDSEAAIQHRLNQARTLIRRVTIEYGAAKKEVRRFYHITDEQGPHYVNIHTVAASAKTMAMARQELITDLVGIQESLSELDELVGGDVTKKAKVSNATKLVGKAKDTVAAIA